MKKRMPVHYGWIICMACAVLIVCTMGLASSASFAVYLPFVREQFGYTGVQTSAVITIRSFFVILGMLFVDRFYARTEIRRGMTAACLLAAAAFVCFCGAKSLPVFYLGGALAGLSYGLGSIIPVAVLVSRWFQGHRAPAIAICSSGTGLATLCFPGLITRVVEDVGLREAFLMEAALIALMAILIYCLVRNAPAEMGLLPVASGREKRNEKKERCGECRPLARAEWAFLLLAMALLGAAAVLATSNMALLYRTEGIDSTLVARAISLYGVMLIVSKLIMGTLQERIGTYAVNYIFSAVLIAGLTLSCFVGVWGKPCVLASALLLGVGFPISTVGLPLWAADFSTEQGYGKMLKRLQLAYQIGALVLSTAPGALADATGSYIPAFALFAVFIGITLVIVQMTYKRAVF